MDDVKYWNERRDKQKGMTLTCVPRCGCVKFVQNEEKINSTYLYPDRCVCGHTKINHRRVYPVLKLADGTQMTESEKGDDVNV